MHYLQNKLAVVIMYKSQLILRKGPSTSAGDYELFDYLFCNLV